MEPEALAEKFLLEALTVGATPVPPDLAVPPQQGEELTCTLTQMLM